MGEVTGLPDIGTFEFDVVKEEWNEYTLSDQTRVRGRPIVFRIGKPGKASGPPFLLAPDVSISICAPLAKRGNPGPLLTRDEQTPTDEKLKSGLLIPIDIITSSELWNIYRIRETGDLLQVKLLLSNVFRIKDRFDIYGEPAYILLKTGTVVLGMKGTYPLKVGPK